MLTQYFPSKISSSIILSTMMVLNFFCWKYFCFSSKRTIINLPIHRLWHSWVCSVSPEHCLPIPAAIGLLQTRCRCWVPEPHLDGQSVHGDQLDHPPSTRRVHDFRKKEVKLFYSLLKLSLTHNWNLMMRIYDFKYHHTLYE